MIVFANSIVGSGQYSSNGSCSDGMHPNYCVIHGGGSGGGSINIYYLSLDSNSSINCVCNGGYHSDQTTGRGGTGGFEIKKIDKISKINN